MPSDNRRYWYGIKPTDCEWCGRKLDGVFIDGATRKGWRLLCEPCHATHGYGLGTGLGQKYLYQSSADRWFKDTGNARIERTTDLQTRLFS